MTPLWLRPFVVWLAIIAAETVHDVLRILFLQPVVGDPRTRQIGVATGSLIMLGIAYLASAWLRIASTAGLFRVGLLWVVLTLLFEIGLGRLVLKLSWERIVSDYDPARGGFLSAGLVVLMLSPLIAARLRVRRRDAEHFRPGM